jgi:hypothetical protein
VALKTSFLGINKRYFAPVFLRPYRKVQPDGNKGKRVGVAYELDNGEIIYVPE